MNKQEAEEELESLVEIQEAMFCPMTRSKCRKDCVCFVSRITSNRHKDTEYCTPYAYCNNSMISENLPE